MKLHSHVATGGNAATGGTPNKPRWSKLQQAPFIGNSALALQRLSRSIASAREGVNWITGRGDIHRLCNFQDGVPDAIAATHNAVSGLLVGSRQVESPIVFVYQCVYKLLVHVCGIHLRETQKGDYEMADIMTIVLIFAPSP